jgi:hypothetical protein
MSMAATCAIGADRREPERLGADAGGVTERKKTDPEALAEGKP